MADFEIAYAPLKDFEGGYDNDPDDRGGETYAGIARKFFPSWQGWKLIDQIKKTNKTRSAINQAAKADRLLRDYVRAWYKTTWFDALGLGELPQPLANEIFEQSVNLGKSGSGKKVQIICNAYNYQPGAKKLFADLKVDGAIGPKTLAALKIILANKANAESLVHALNCMQGAHYLELAAKKFTQRKYTVGWMKRTHCEA
ncbi:MAG: surface-binding protein [Desulfovibrio sp.]|jgi:lysozyme family protein|nr:surface-binding protein [Desulfovibrio sp.]